MNDILLTQEQEDAAVEAFCERYRKQYGGRPPEARIAEERRRAQVRNIDTAFLESLCQNLQKRIDASDDIDFKVALSRKLNVVRGIQKTLKAAGEGK